MLQKEQLTNNQHNHKILLPMINTPQYPLLLSHQEKPPLLCQEKSVWVASCKTRAREQDRGNKGKKSHFPFSHDHRICFVPVTQGTCCAPCTELHKGGTTKQILCSHRTEITITFQTSLPVCLSGKSRTELGSGWAQGKGGGMNK